MRDLKNNTTLQEWQETQQEHTSRLFLPYESLEEAKENAHGMIIAVLRNVRFRISMPDFLDESKIGVDRVPEEDAEEN